MLFSLNSIKKLPDQIQLPMEGFLARLCALNMDLPDFKENTHKIIESEIYGGETLKKAPKSDLLKITSDLRNSLATDFPSSS